MKLGWTALIGVATPQMSVAAELPNRLRCELTGSAGCPEGGICVGGGVSLSGVRVTVDT